MLMLTPEQTRIVEEANKPIAITDAQQHREYVILTRDTYERIRRVLRARGSGPVVLRVRRARP
jgi:PHD/YefM family antitoxin component YafN of YafNO toxin-antitoxin module